MLPIGGAKHCGKTDTAKPVSPRRNVAGAVGDELWTPVVTLQQGPDAIVDRINGVQFTQPTSLVVSPRIQNAGKQMKLPRQCDLLTLPPAPYGRG